MTRYIQWSRVQCSTVQYKSTRTNIKVIIIISSENVFLFESGTVHAPGKCQDQLPIYEGTGRQGKQRLSTVVITYMSDKCFDNSALIRHVFNH